MKRKVFAAIDLGPTTPVVLRVALTLARERRAELTLLHVAMPEPAFVGYQVGPQSVRDQRAAELRTKHRALQRLTEQSREQGVEATPLVVEGAVADKLVELAELRRAGLLVVGFCSGGPLRHAIRGSVAHQLLRDAPCPVLVVPRADQPDGSVRRVDF